MPLYAIEEARQMGLAPVSAAARAGVAALDNPWNPFAYTHVGRMARAALEVLARSTARYEKPKFDISTTTVNGRELPVQVGEPVWEKPFCKLLPFRVEGLTPQEAAARFNILLVAPMSGHYATLLRGTVEALLPHANIYVTDWQSARDVPHSAGHFDIDDYTDYVRDMIRLFKGNTHVFAVCQPSVPVLAATALMECNKDDVACLPLSIVIAGGPVDTRTNPTEVNRFPQSKGATPEERLRWFERNVISGVPFGCKGFGRKVYPGFLQLGGFLTMNLDRHVNAVKDFFIHLVKGDGDSAERHRKFYDEYLAVMDLTAEFYLQTIDRVFLRHALPKGDYVYREGTSRAQPVMLKDIRRVPIMTIEGGEDDITGRGQCEAALALTGLPQDMRQPHLEPDVGHYGIFNGKRFVHNIVPAICCFMGRFTPRAGHDPKVVRLDTFRHQPGAG